MTNTLASKIKEDPIIITLREAVGEDSFRRLRDLFEHYSAYSGKMHYMDSFEYNKFMKATEELFPCPPLELKHFLIRGALPPALCSVAVIQTHGLFNTEQSLAILMLSYLLLAMRPDTSAKSL